MKKILFSIIAASTLLVTGCGTSSYYAFSDFQDGIYYRASKEEQAQKELDAKEVLNLIDRTIQMAKALSDTIQHTEVLAGISGLQLPWETDPSYWGYNYPWNFYGNGNWSGYYGWGYAPGYYGWGYIPSYYTWDPWFYGPNTPWGPSFGWSFGWDPWYYGPYWSFYGGYYGNPWNPYWGWGYYPPCWYPPHYAQGGSSTGYYFGRRDATHGGALASGGHRAVGVRGNVDGSSVRGKDVTPGQSTSGRTVRGLHSGNVRGNFRKSEQSANRQLPDFNRTGNTIRRENGISWDNNGLNSSRYNDRNTSTYRNPGSTGIRTSGSTGGGSVRSTGGSGGGGRVGPRR